MCAFVCDGSCRSSSSGGSGMEVIESLFRGLYFVVRRIAIPAVFYSTLTAGLFVAGSPLTPRARRLRTASGATWLKAGGKTHPARLRIHWYAFPGWQRTLARIVLAALIVATYLAPLVVAICAALAAVATGSVVVRRKAVRRRAVGPRVVKAVVGDHTRPAIAATPASRPEAWFSVLKQKVKAGR